MQGILSNKIHPFFTQTNDSNVITPLSEGHIYQGNIANVNWVDASNLQVGYKLLSEDGSWQTVKNVRLTDEQLSAYNLTVNHNHTYFVTANVGQYGVWVHNDCFENLTSRWSKGSFIDSLSSLQEHFNKHGAEVGAKSVDEYLRKAEGFKQNLRGATKSRVQGATEGVWRYKKNGKYIDIAPDGTIISFGKQ